MSSLDGAIDEPAHSLDTFSQTGHVKDENFKTEDVKEDIELNNDADMNEQPASEDDEPNQDDGMDLFGEDEIAEEVKHEDSYVVSRSSASRILMRNPNTTVQLALCHLST